MNDTLTLPASAPPETPPPAQFSLLSPRSDEDFEAYFLFRWRQLRAPLKFPRGSERDDDDAGAHHVMARNERNEIIGGARLHLNENRRMQVRYMAVAENYRRRGVASAMLARLEDAARIAGHRVVTLNARKEAVPFYLGRGYTIIGDAHADIGTPHCAMLKHLDKDE